MSHPSAHPSTQRLSIFVAGCLILTGFLLAPLAHSDNLTEEEVLNFIGSMEAMQPLVDKHKTFIDSVQNKTEPDMSRMMSSMVQQVEGHAMYDDLDSLVDDYGFRNPDTWAAKGDRIINAWFAIELEGQETSAPDMAELEKALAELENNPDLPEASKAQMRAMMEQSVQAITAAMHSARQATEADKNAVRPHVQQLKAAMEGSKDGFD